MHLISTILLLKLTPQRYCARFDWTFPEYCMPTPWILMANLAKTSLPPRTHEVATPIYRYTDPSYGSRPLETLTHTVPDLSYARVLTESGLPQLSQRREDLCRDFFRDMLPPLTGYTIPAAGSMRHAIRPAWSCRAPQNACLMWLFPPKKSLVVQGLRHWQ